MLRKEWFVGLFIFCLLASLLAACSSAKEGFEEGVNEATEQTEKEETTEQADEEYPSLIEETMDKDCILNAEGGDEVSLWDKPTSSAGGARLRDKVPCGTRCWAFNKYYNEEYNITFYAINTNDPRVKNAYGWVTEDLITWSE